jgi:hypothetical protein
VSHRNVGWSADRQSTYKTVDGKKEGEYLLAKMGWW